MRTSFLSVAAVFIGQQVLADLQIVTQISDGQPDGPTVTLLTQISDQASYTTSEYTMPDFATHISDHRSQASFTASAASDESLTRSGLWTRISNYQPQGSSTATGSAASASSASSSGAAASSPAVAFTSSGSLISIKTAFGAMVGLSIAAMML